MKPVLLARTASDSIYTRIVFPEYILVGIRSEPFIALGTGIGGGYGEATVVTANDVVRSHIGYHWFHGSTSMGAKILSSEPVCRLAQACFYRCPRAGLYGWTVVSGDPLLDTLLWQLLEAVNDELFFVTSVKKRLLVGLRVNRHSRPT